MKFILILSLVIIFTGCTDHQCSLPLEVNPEPSLFDVAHRAKENMPFPELIEIVRDGGMPMRMVPKNGEFWGQYRYWLSPGGCLENLEIKIVEPYMKVVMHEYGEALGLIHLPDTSCIMYCKATGYRWCQESIDIMKHLYGDYIGQHRQWSVALE